MEKSSTRLYAIGDEWVLDYPHVKIVRRAVREEHLRKKR
jgi:hypothetical protein